MILLWWLHRTQLWLGHKYHSNDNFDAFLLLNKSLSCCCFCCSLLIFNLILNQAFHIANPHFNLFDFWFTCWLLLFLHDQHYKDNKGELLFAILLMILDCFDGTYWEFGKISNIAHVLDFQLASFCHLSLFISSKLKINRI